MQPKAVIPLAAICQIAKLVQKCARYGTFNENEVHTFLQSILNTAPQNPEDVYDDHFALKGGYQALVAQLSSDGEKDVEIVKYVGSLLQLERALSSNDSVFSELAKRIEQVERQTLHFNVYDEQVLGALADIYTQVISPAGPKIQVFGKPDLLQQTHIQHKIRALLLAGIRSAVLWRQLGGKRRHFFFSKKKIVHTAQQFI